MRAFDDLSSLLRAYFCNEFYADGIRNLKNDIAKRGIRANAWENVVPAIRNRAFLPGQPLELVNEWGNQLLEENTDADAYQWLDLMVENVQRTGDEIREYPPTKEASAAPSLPDVSPAPFPAVSVSQISLEPATTPAPAEAKTPAEFEGAFRALHGKDEAARAAAVKTLRKAGLRMVEPLLESFRRETVEPQAGECAVDLLSALGNSVRERMLAALADGYGGVRALAVAMLRRISGREALDLLIGATEDSSPVVRRIAVCNLGELGDPRAIEAMARVLHDVHEESGVQAAAMGWMGRFTPEQVLAHVKYGLDHRDLNVRREALNVLTRWQNVGVLVELAGQKTLSQGAVALMLGKMGDRRAIAPLIVALDDESWTVQVAAVRFLVSLFVKYGEWQILPALMAFLDGKRAPKEVRLAVIDALPALKQSVDARGRAFIEDAFRRYRDREEEKEHALLHVDAQPDAPFTFETYQAFVGQVKSMVSNYRAPFGGVYVGHVPERLAVELPPLYQSKLPVYVLARCPICGAKVSEPVDTFSLSGLGWWVSEPSGFGWLGRPVQRISKLYALIATRTGGPSYRAGCVHARAVSYGVNLHGIIPDDVVMPGYVVIGSERPGVLRPFMERDGSCAVIRALPVGRLDDAKWQPRYTAYFVSYFNEDVNAFAASLAPLDWYGDEFVWPYEQLDYDLAPWAGAGKVFWLGTEADDYTLQREPPAGFPHADENGLVGRWIVNEEKGAALLPEVSGHPLYGRYHGGFRRVKPIEEQALLRRQFHKKDA
ncbi:MAG: HEAT repeat domain-containing protein [Anaerolineae bacterium]|nr:HEAT repeat domain-containing protein [Anaerolineae bacterium]